MRALHEIMSNKISKHKLSIMITMLVADSEDDTLKAKIEGLFTARVVKARLEPLGITVKSNALAYLLLGVETPGEAVLIAYSIFRISKDLGKSDLAIDDFTHPQYYGTFYYTKDELRHAWAAQKDGGANKLDYIETWE